MLRTIPPRKTCWKCTIASRQAARGTSFPACRRTVLSVLSELKQHFGTESDFCYACLPSNLFLIFHKKQRTRLLKASTASFNQARRHQGLGQRIREPVVLPAPSRILSDRRRAVPIGGGGYHDAQRTAEMAKHIDNYCRLPSKPAKSGSSVTLPFLYATNKHIWHGSDQLSFLSSRRAILVCP